MFPPPIRIGEIRCLVRMSEWCVAGAVRAMTTRTVVPEKIANRSAAGFRCRSSLRKRSSSNGYVNENKCQRNQNQTEKKETHHSSIYSGPVELLGYSQGRR